MTTAARTYTEEASHWYKPTGEPCYEVERSDGKGMRPTTLRDAKKLGLVPSVTTILKCIAKPELENWKREQDILAVLTTPRIVGEADDAFVHRVLNTERVQDQEAQAARTRGTEIHRVIEDYFGGKQITGEIAAWVLPVIEAVDTAEFVTSEKTMSCVDGYGGMIDLVQKSDKWIITDFKTCKKLPEKGSWLEHRLQLSAYARMFYRHCGFAISVEDVNLDPAKIITRNVYISTTEKGKFAIYEHDSSSRDYTEGFAPLLRYWRWANGMLT